jgi:hypothetical protein
MACDINQLADDGKDFYQLSKLEFLAAKDFLLAVLVRDTGGADYTNLAKLADSMEKYESLPDYKQRAAYLQVLRASLTGDPNVVTPAQFWAAVKPAVCKSPDALAKAEIFLMCTLLTTPRQ